MNKKDLTPKRLEKFTQVVANRQPDLTVILENVHDPHNISAVLRSCESVGVKEIFVLFTEPQLDEQTIVMGKRTSAGSRKWVDVHLFRDPKTCFEEVKKKYKTILSTHLSEDAADLYALDLTQSVALMFGNEADGLSEEALSYSDGNFLIPQVGMVQSLNISVACAVTLFEALRQRKNKGYYGNHPQWQAEEQNVLMEDYIRRHYDKRKNANPKRSD